MDYRAGLPAVVADLPAVSRWPTAGNRLVYRCVAELLLRPDTSAGTRRWADRATYSGVVFRAPRAWERARAEVPRVRLLDALTRQVRHRQPIEHYRLGRGQQPVAGVP
ncbi:hypothetical protein [Amycolatopsis sp. NPDC051071]|uniref:hypothetical protein n=1 Tax=Amycolatopsis sp. NPDC051071 TaxID=3154637 RepID=UPI003431E633